MCPFYFCVKVSVSKFNVKPTVLSGNSFTIIVPDYSYIIIKDKAAIIMLMVLSFFISTDCGDQKEFCLK